uniref:Uncharacterized protein n=1 Tax=Cannabis sativa TaxID=3483 RepID=A0A803QZ28_CANSA
MAFSATFSHSSFPRFSYFSDTHRRSPLCFLSVRAVKSAEPEKEKKAPQPKTKEDPSTSTSTASSTPKKILKKEKPVYSMKKGQIVRVDKEKYLNSVNVCAFGVLNL